MIQFKEGEYYITPQREVVIITHIYRPLLYTVRSGDIEWAEYIPINATKTCMLYVFYTDGDFAKELRLLTPLEKAIYL